MSYYSYPLGSDVATGQGVTIDSYCQSTGVCVPYELAKRCAGDGNRWREMIALNPGKITNAGATSSYNGVINIPSDWSCPPNIPVVATTTPGGGGGGAAVPVGPGPIVPVPGPTPTPSAPVTDEDEAETNYVVPIVAVIAGGLIIGGTIWAMNQKKGKRRSKPRSRRPAAARA